MVTSPAPAPRTRGSVDLDAILDSTRCPVCRTVLASAVCGSCGADLTGTTARAVWDLSRRIAGLVDERSDAVAQLRRESVARRTAGERTPVGPPAVPVPVPSAAPPVAPVAAPPPAPPAAPPPPFPPAPVPAPAAPGPRLGVQGLLVALGALLLAVAALVFLAFAWDAMGIGGRAAVVGGVTLAALAGSAFLKPRLEATGEAVGALAAVLVLADVWAVRRTGLFGADEVGTFLYSGSGLLVAALVLGGWALRWRVRAGSVVAAAVLPVSALLLGLATGHPEPTSLATGAGLLAAAAVALVRGAVPAGWDVERVVLRLAAAVGLLLAPLAAISAEADRRWTGVALVAAAAVLAGLQATAERHRGVRPDRPALPPLWSAAAGLLLAAAAATAAGRAVAPASEHVPWLLAGPVGAAALALVVLALAGPALERAGVRARAAALAAGAVTVVLLSADVLVAVVASAGPALAAVVRPWDADVRDSVLDVVRAAGTGPDDGAWPPAVAAACAALVVVALALVVGHRVRPAVVGLEAPWSAPLLLGAAAVTALCVPGLPVAATVAGLALLAFAVTVGRLRVGADRTGPGARAARLSTRVVGATAGGLAVVDAWSVPALSVPLTLLGAAALLAARAAQPRVVGPALTGAATVATAVAAGGAAGLLGLPVADRVTTAGLAGALLVALAHGAARFVPDDAGPARLAVAPSTAERLAASAAGSAVALVATLAAASDAGTTGSRGPVALLLAALLGAALVAALSPTPASRQLPAASPDPSQTPAPPAPPFRPAPWIPPGEPVDVGRLARGTRLGFAGAVPALAAAAAVAAVERFADPAGRLLADAVAARGLVAAAAVAACALVLAGLAALRPAVAADPRRLAAEAGLGVAGGVALLLALADPEGGKAWVTLLLAGVAASAVASASDRRAVGWLAWVLLSASSWVRLALGDVRVVEAYTLPPAAALLAVAALRVRRERATATWRVLAPGAGLALVPSVLASAGGGDLRPWLLLATGAGLVAAGTLPVGTGPRAALLHRVGGVLVVAGAAAVLGPGLLRTTVGTAFTRDPLADGAVVPTALDVERWSVPAALVLLAAAVVLAVRHRGVALRAQGLLLVPGLVVLVGPSTLAAAAATSDGAARLGGGDAATWPVAARLGAAFVLLAGFAVVAAARPLAGGAAGPDGRPAPSTLLLTWPAAVLAGTGAGVVGLVAVRVLDVPVEVFTVSAGALAVALGALRLGVVPGLRSWPALGGGLALVLVPTLLLAAGGALWRVLGVVVVAGAVVAAGAARRLAAPVALGSGVLVAHAVVQLAPFVADLVTSPWRWVVFALVGGLLLVLGATYERQLVRLRVARTRLAALR